MSLSYIRDYYQVPAVVGRRVTAYGKPGVILSAINAYIGVALDEDPKKRILPHHPTDEIVYCDEVTKAEDLPLKEWEVLTAGRFGCWHSDWQYIVRVWACTRAQAKYAAYVAGDDCYEDATAMLSFKVRRA